MLINFTCKEEDLFDNIYQIAETVVAICKENNKMAEEIYKKHYTKEKTKARTVTNYDRTKHTYIELVRGTETIEDEIARMGQPTIVARLVISKILKEK